MDDLYALVYVSDAAAPFSEADLEDLLESSRVYNERVGVTGFLAYDEPWDGEGPGTFVQRLEGTREAVLEVYRTRVRPSSRHENVVVKLEGPIGRREFSDWTMAFELGRQKEAGDPVDRIPNGL